MASNNEKYKSYSVLMSVYYKENPYFLKMAMDSIYLQSVKTDDFVLVCDGVLPAELYEIIHEMKNKFGEVLNIVQLEKNMGLGIALNEGIKFCKNELIARMDSDDISFSGRCESQMKIFNENHEISICQVRYWNFLTL